MPSPAVLPHPSSLAGAGVSGSAAPASREGDGRGSELPGKFDGGGSSSYRGRSQCVGRLGCCSGSCRGGVRGGLCVSVGPDGGNTLADDLACLSSSSQRMSAAAMVEELEYEGLTNNDSVAINMAAGAMAGPSSRSLTSQDRTCCSCDSFSRYRRARRHVPHRQSQGRPTTL